VTTATTRRAPGGKKTRDRQRLAHLVTGALLILYVYLPGTPNSILQASIRWVILPLLVIDGLLMWQWPKVRRLARRWAGKS
jgi:hypothetical protein